MTITPAFEWPAATPAPTPAAPPPPPGPSPHTMQIRADVAAKAYRDLRDKKKQIAERHAEELKPFNDAMGQLEGVLLDALNQSGANSLKTEGGTVYKSTRVSYAIEDPHLLRQWVEAQNRPDLYENRVSKEAIDAMIAAGEQLPPGIKVNSFTSVNIRK